jgi:hypothetical protein
MKNEQAFFFSYKVLEPKERYGMENLPFVGGHVVK